MSESKKNELRNAVRDAYAEVAKKADSCCSSSQPSCCGTHKDPAEISKQMGYSEAELAAVPKGANLGLGCGNPQAIAALKKGEVVLDLGAGGGFDCFLAAREVGPTGKVIGVDMTPEMLTKARKNAETSEFDNVEFRLGEIEALPVADQSVDVILSNCVINLSPDKRRVYQEAFRVLKKGGRLAISDMVATAPMPDDIKKDLSLYTKCVSGASLIDDLEKMLKEVGFSTITISPKEEHREIIRKWDPDKNVEDYVIPSIIEAVKP